MNNLGQSTIRQVMLAGGSVFIASAIALIARPDLFGQFIGIVGEDAFWSLRMTGIVLIPLGVLVAYVIFFGTVVPFWLYFIAFKYLDSKKAAIFGLLEPVGASVVALFLLGETFIGIQILGGILVLIGVIYAETARK